MFRSIAAAALFAALSAPALAQGADVYEARITSLQVQASQAEVVGICGIRSNAWVTSITTGVALTGPLLAQKMGIDRARADGIVQRAYQTSRPHMPTSESCQAMANSDLVAKLDRLQMDMSGGYH